MENYAVDSGQQLDEFSETEMTIATDKYSGEKLERRETRRLSSKRCLIAVNPFVYHWNFSQALWALTFSWLWASLSPCMTCGCMLHLQRHWLSDTDTHCSRIRIWEVSGRDLNLEVVSSIDKKRGKKKKEWSRKKVEWSSSGQYGRACHYRLRPKFLLNSEC